MEAAFYRGIDRCANRCTQIPINRGREPIFVLASDHIFIVDTFLGKSYYLPNSCIQVHMESNIPLAIAMLNGSVQERALNL